MWTITHHYYYYLYIICPQHYIKLTINEVQTLFLLRSRSINVKGNHSSAHEAYHILLQARADILDDWSTPSELEDPCTCLTGMQQIVFVLFVWMWIIILIILTRPIIVLLIGTVYQSMHTRTCALVWFSIWPLWVLRALW